MKQHKNELDVDIIGGTEPLTKEEEKAISKFKRTQAKTDCPTKSRNRQQKYCFKRGCTLKHSAAYCKTDAGYQ